MMRPGAVDIQPQSVLCGLADLREVLEKPATPDSADGIAFVACDSQRLIVPSTLLRGSLVWSAFRLKDCIGLSVAIFVVSDSSSQCSEPDYRPCSKRFISEPSIDGYVNSRP